MAEAESWDDLNARLLSHGYELRPAGGDVALHKRSCATLACKGSEIGFAYHSLMRRFGCAMPGHPHGTLGEGVAADETAQHSLNNTQKGRLQRSLGPEFKSAPDWQTLIHRLLRRGYTLRAQGTGLAIYGAQDGRHLCNTATVGFRYRALVKKFGAPMPGHDHGMKWLAGHTTKAKLPEDEAEFDVIERDGPLARPQTQIAPAQGRGA